MSAIHQPEREVLLDTDLANRSAAGDRAAFGAIVARYQALVCSVTWSVCGDLGQSEELAQETFVAAWASLRSLQDPAKLKPWLCGIARNVARQALRRQSRVPTAKAETLDETSPFPGASPRETAMSREEAALLWAALKQLPETYREPMVLFYREEESVRAVAESLALSEGTVKQRLARGRRMLAEQLARVRSDLVRVPVPGEAFTQGVLAALPLGTLPGATGIGSLAAQGAATKSAGLIGLAKVLVSPLLGILGSYFGYRLELAEAPTPERRRQVRRFFLTLLVGFVLFTAASLSLGIFGMRFGQAHPSRFVGLVCGLCLAYVGFLLWLVVSQYRRQIDCSPSPANAPVPMFEYRSKLCLLGLPFIHIRLRGGLQRGAVKAWIAVGDAALGAVFAFGGLAIAPVSLGGLSLGLVTLGGLGAGPLAIGGVSLGYWAAGGFAIGWQAFGGCAIAWLAAMGGTALAHDFAQGAVAFGCHANDSAAAAFVHASPFFQNAMAAANSGWLQLVNLLWLFPWVLWRIAKRRKSRAR